MLTRKGLRSIEVKYTQNTFITPNTIADPNAIATLLDTNQTATTPKVSFTSGIVQGNSRFTRVGNKIFVRDLRFRGLLQASQQTNAVSELYVSILVLRTKNAPGATNSHSTDLVYLPNVWDFVNNTASPPTINGQNGGRGAFISHFKHYNKRWKDDFTILKYRTYKIAKDTGSGANKRLLKFNIRVNKPAFWDDSGNTGDGQLFMYYWCDQTTTGDVAISDGDRPVMWGAFRVTYTDA